MTEHEARLGMQVRCIPLPKKPPDPNYYEIAALYRRNSGDTPRACLRKIGGRRGRRRPIKLAPISELFEVRPLPGPSQHVDLFEVRLSGRCMYPT